MIGRQMGLLVILVQFASLPLLVGCHPSKKNSVTQERTDAGPAALAFAAYQENDVGSEKVGKLTKDEILDRYAVAKLGIALDAKCSLLSSEVRQSAVSALTAIDAALPKIDVDSTIVKRVNDGARTIAANLVCDDKAKTSAGRVPSAVSEICSSLEDVCPNDGNASPAVENKL